MTSDHPPSPPRDLSALARPSTAPAPTTIAPPPRRWKTRVLLPGAIVVIALALVAVTAANTLVPAAPIHVVPVVARTVTDTTGRAGTVTVQAPGWLEPDPHPSYVAALADGVVAEVLVLEGEPVEAGQVVARLVDDDARLALARAAARLQERQAAAQSARADLTAAETRLANLVERTRAVDLASAVLAEAEAEVAKADADIAVERARTAELRDELDRKAQLVEAQAVSEAVVARLRLRLDAQSAIVDAAVARRAVLDAKRVAAATDLRAAARHRELLIDERRAVAQAGAAVASADAAVALAAVDRDDAGLQLSRMDVRAPVAGMVLRRLVVPGSKLTRAGAEHSAHVVHVYDPAHLQARVDVPLADAAHVAVGQPAEVTVEVLPDRVFTGRVTRVVHEADIQKNTVEVKVAIDDPIDALKPEMLARIRFLGTPPSGASGAAPSRDRVFAPEALVRDDTNGTAALVVSSVVDGRGRVERRAVVRGTRRVNGWIEVESGLRVGDLLVADPRPGLEPGDRVRVVGEAEGT